MKNPSVWALRPRSWLSTSGYVVPYIEDATEPSTFTMSNPRTFGRRAISKDRQTPLPVLSLSLRTHVPFGNPKDSSAERSETCTEIKIS